MIQRSPNWQSCWPEPLRPGGGDAESDAVPRATFDRMRAKFPTAAIAVLELTGDWGQLGPGTARLAGFGDPPGG